MSHESEESEAEDIGREEKKSLAVCFLNEISSEVTNRVDSNVSVCIRLGVEAVQPNCYSAFKGDRPGDLVAPALATILRTAVPDRPLPVLLATTIS